MKRLLAWIQGVAVTLGGPGLFIIGYLDSSFLSFPEVNDLLIVGMVMKHPHLLPYYAFMATLGSTLGCLTIYYVARKGGEAFLRKRFKEHHVDGGLKLFQKYGLLVLIVPALLPPPAPFKIFVILAGAAKMSPWTFALAIVLGRGFRYFGEGLLAVWYGERALDFIQAHGREVGLAMGLLVLIGGVIYFLWRRRRTPAGTADYGTS